MTVYRQFNYWSAFLGGPAVRLSVPDERGREFFALVAKPSNGLHWQRARDGALEAIEAAIERGDPPGKVDVTEDEHGER